MLLSPSGTRMDSPVPESAVQALHPAAVAIGGGVNEPMVLCPLSGATLSRTCNAMARQSVHRYSTTSFVTFFRAIRMPLFRLELLFSFNSIATKWLQYSYKEFPRPFQVHTTYFSPLVINTPVLAGSSGR